MKIGYVGLGKMGKNMVLRLLEKGHEVVVWNRSSEASKVVAKEGAVAAENLQALAAKLESPRVIWMMLPAGKPTELTLQELSTYLEAGDIVINGANEFYKEDLKHAKLLNKKAIRYIDAGVSGGQEGARNGATIMVGGESNVYEKLESLFNDLAAPNACEFFEGVGAGHYVKMVHNGIEYGMMQAIAEGFDILKHSEFDLDLNKVAQVYNQKSIIESRLIGWMQSGFEEYGVDLAEISGSAGSGGAAGMSKSEAKWTLDVAKDLGIEAKNIESAVQARIESQENPSYQGQLINTLRNQFGGHSVK